MIKNQSPQKLQERPRLQSEELYIELKQGNKIGFIFSIKFISVTIMIYIIWWWKQNVKMKSNKGCFYDPIHQILDPINKIVNTDPVVAWWLQVSSSILMDFAFFGTLIFWMLYGKSFKLIAATFLFYTFRYFNQLMFKMEYPQGFFWDDPGIPSLVVPYGFTSDFFFSGHCGFLTLIYQFWSEKGYKQVSQCIIFVLLYQIFVLETFRNHYSIDISTGIAVAFWIFYFLTEKEEQINQTFLSIICKTCNIKQQ